MVGTMTLAYAVLSAIAGFIMATVITGSSGRGFGAAIISGGIGGGIGMFPFFPTVAGTFSFPLIIGIAAAIGTEVVK